MLNSVFNGHILFMRAVKSNRETHTVHVLWLNSVCLWKKIFILLWGSVDKTLIYNLSRDPPTNYVLHSAFQCATMPLLPGWQSSILSLLSVFRHDKALRPPYRHLRYNRSKLHNRFFQITQVFNAVKKVWRGLIAHKHWARI